MMIISGGQTGVDRAALDAALHHNVACGGYCPEGRKAEDGAIPDRYPLEEIKGAGYNVRTRKNVQESDGTVIIYFGRLSGGTEKTLLYCLNEKKPYLLIDASEVTPDRAGMRISEFYATLPNGKINFAGPRASSEERAYDYAFEAVNRFIERTV